MILLLENVHAVLLAEKRLRAAGVPCTLVPTPKELSADCGMSLEIAPNDHDRATAALSGLTVRAVG